MPWASSWERRRLTALVMLLVSGCAASHHSASGAGAPVVVPVSTLPPTTVATSSTTAPHPPGLGFGDSGAAVLALEQRLSALHYDVGAPDGHFGPADQFAVVAFEKVNGMARTGRATDDVVAAMASASDPAPLVPTGGAMRVEVDLPRQVLFLYQNNQLVRILPVSTGSGQRYCVDGACDVAVTPGGSFRIGRKLLGLEISRLGQLYNPLYFNGGIAIHGEPAVPSYPASHGCVRIPMNSSLWFYNEVPSGTPVYVVGGPHAPVPFNEQAPPAGATATSLPASTSVPARPSTTTMPSTAPARTSTTRPPSTTMAPPTTAPPTSTATA